MNIATTLEHKDQYDAIVIGSGISGGWAAKELCEKGLKTLVLERGRMVKHIDDYHTMHLDPWDFKNRGKQHPSETDNQYNQRRLWGGALTRPESRHFFVDDQKHPYNEIQDFLWIRAYQVGGRSLVWGRQTYRWSDLDFEANKKEGIGIDWPIRYKDIAPWYDKVEEYIGVSGQAEGLAQVPDGKFTPPIALNCVEEHLKKSVAEKMDGRVVTNGRVAHLTGETKREGRSNCQFRNRCVRGCPFGGYFSSQASTLPAAAKTGNMDLRPHSIVSEIVYDAGTKKAKGVKFIDEETKEEFFVASDIVFVCASAIASAAILLQSKSERFPNGLGNDSGELGHNIMDHHYEVGASGVIEGFEDSYYKGRKPTGFYIPRFRNLGDKNSKKDYLRGFGYQGGASRQDWSAAVAELSFGKELKERLLKPGSWTLGMTGFGECLPYHENKMTLNYKKLDDWGLPTVDFDAAYRENELKMRKDMKEQAVAMLEAAGCKNINSYDGQTIVGSGIHEMGTARMGHDPKTSVLNKYNQIHTVPNVYVTDGACMTSSGCQNPSITYMALTARAVDHAVKEFNKTKNS